MTKTEAKALQIRHKMNIIRNDITGAGQGLYVDTPAAIPELDTLTETDMGRHIICQRVLMGDQYRYKLILPASWFDRWGWA